MKNKHRIFRANHMFQAPQRTKIVIALLLLASIGLLVSYSCVALASAQTTPTPTSTSNAATPNFSMSISPSSFTVLAGTTQTSTIKLYSIARYNGTVNLSATTTSSEITANLALTSLSVKYNQAPSTNITMAISSVAAAGQYNVIVTGISSGGSLTHSVSISINVIKPDFSVSASPSYLTVVAGSTETSTIKVSPIQRFNGTVNLSSSASTGVTASLASSSLAIKFNQSATTTITIAVPTTTSAGKYNVVITGQNTGGSISHSVNIGVQVIHPDFSISASPSYLSIDSGHAGTSLIRLNSLNLFNGTVSLTAQPPSGWTTPVFVHSSLKLTYGSSNSTVMTISVPPQTSSGQYTLIVTGKSASGISHSVTLTIQVLNPDFSMYAAPSSLSIASGTQENTTIHLYGTNRFNGSVTLAASAPNGWDTPTFLMSPLWIDYAHTNATLLTISVPAGTADGQYSVTVAGVSGSLIHSVTVNVQVLNPNFGMSASPSILYLIAGTSGTSTVTLSPKDRFNGTVNLTAQAPSGWTTPKFLQSALSINYAQGATTEVTVSVPSGTFDGNYIVTLTGTSGSLTHSVSLTVQVITPDIALSASPSLITIPAGSSGNITVGVVALGRYNGTIALSATTPSGWTITFYKPTLTVAYNHTTDSTKLNIAIPKGTAPGVYTIQITGTGSQLSLTDTISATVIVK